MRTYAPQIPLIFITSLENRAIDGYDVDAFGFLVKKALIRMENVATQVGMSKEMFQKKMYETKI